MEKEDGHVAHSTILARWRNPRNAREFTIRHGQAPRERSQVQS
jgi:hypothetical protein